MAAGSAKLPYKKIFLLYRKPASKCEFFEVKEDQEGYLAYCRVLNRYLTMYAVAKCEKYWQTCPYRKIGLQIESPPERR